MVSVKDNTSINVHSLFISQIYKGLQYVTYNSNTSRHKLFRFVSFLVHKTQMHTGRFSRWSEWLLNLRKVKPSYWSIWYSDQLLKGIQQAASPFNGS